ncbi:MAG: dTMP kinase [Thermomicrobiales bacterium]
MENGYFIALEGPDGSGKTTQARLLSAALTSEGYEVVVTREPGGTPLAENIRGLLLTVRGYDMLAETEALLFAAARAQHVHEVIAPSVAAGRIVISDRFVDSSLAYQGGGRGLDMDGLRAVQAFATGGMEPDLRILLDLPVEVGLKRRYASTEAINRLDEAGIAFHTTVRDTYLQLVSQRPSAWLVVDACQEVDILGQEIALAVVKRLHSARSRIS